jgi:hypothetical protein
MAAQLFPILNLTLNALASVQAVHNLFHIPTFMFLISII